MQKRENNRLYTHVRGSNDSGQAHLDMDVMGYVAFDWLANLGRHPLVGKRYRKFSDRQEKMGNATGTRDIVLDLSRDLIEKPILHSNLSAYNVGIIF